MSELSRTTLSGDVAVPASGEAVLTPVTHPLYPSVQRSMEGLTRIVGSSETRADIQHTEAGEPILTPAIMNAWAEEEGFGNGKRGTYRNDDTYLYIKSCNSVPEEEDVDRALDVARQLTSLGAIHPESRWGVYQIGQGYQLFVVSPKLEAWSLEEKLEGAYEGRPSQPKGDLSHVNEWFKRIDPNFVPGQPIPEDSLLHHLNWTEASNSDNWGWDSTGTLYPVDVEVLVPTTARYKDYEPWNKAHYDWDYLE